MKAFDSGIEWHNLPILPLEIQVQPKCIQSQTHSLHSIKIQFSNINDQFCTPRHLTLLTTIKACFYASFNN